MQVPKPSEHDKERFRALIPKRPGVEVKPMFGNLGAFVNGNMFAGLLGSAIGVRVISPERRGALAALEGAGPFGPADRPMGEYVALPLDWPDDRVTSAVEDALADVAALPAKAPNARRPRASG